jgi:hypothetical protein
VFAIICLLLSEDVSAFDLRLRPRFVVREACNLLRGEGCLAAGGGVVGVLLIAEFARLAFGIQRRGLIAIGVRTLLLDLSRQSSPYRQRQLLRTSAWE